MSRREFEDLADREIRSVLAELKAGLSDLARQAAEPIPQVPLDPSQPQGAQTYNRMLGVRRRQALEAALGQLEQEIQARAGEAFEVAGAEAAAQAAEASGGEGLPGVGINARAVATAQAAAAAEVRNVTEAVRAKLNAAVTKAVAGRSSAAELASELGAAFDVPQPAHRIERIIRTEMAGIWMANQAEVDELLADTGPDLIKRWVTVGGSRGDGRNRDSHLELHGQERELDEPFHVGGGPKPGKAGGATASTAPDDGIGTPAKAPLDAGLPAGERINCRCRFVRVHRSEAKQPYIRKRRNPSRAGAADDLTTG